MAKRMTLKQFLSTSLLTRREALERSLSQLRDIEKALLSKKGAGFTFRVTLSSLWEKDGEKSIRIQQQASLKVVTAEAVTEFKRINRRQDIQARWEVSVILSPDVSISLPESFWAHLKE